MDDFEWSSTEVYSIKLSQENNELNPDRNVNNNNNKNNNKDNNNKDKDIINNNNKNKISVVHIIKAMRDLS